ncbi:MAG: hypothetical protein PVJ57_21255 [Phycisphaerae bacterium]|jgi:hypothetical protein
MFDEHTRNYLTTMAFFQRLPAVQMQGIGGEDDETVPQPAADLIRDWRRMQHRNLPTAVQEELVRCDDNTLFNVVGHCFDILLRRIVPKYDLHRQRRREQKARRQERAGATRTSALATALSGATEQPAGSEPALAPTPT